MDARADAVDVNALLEKTLVLLESDLLEARVTIDRRLDRSLPPVAGSAGELRQAFLHLIKNGADAMKGRGGVLTVETARRGAAVRVSIGDTGTGIAPELLARIFEPFFTTKPDGYGTGLGLPITTWIVQRYGGRLDVETTPGRGSTFHVTLPARPGGAPRGAEGGAG